MRIAIFVWEFLPNLKGSLGMHVTRICRELVKDNHDLNVFTFDTGNLPSRELWAGVEIQRPRILDIGEVSQFLFTDGSSEESNEFLRVFSFNHASTSAFFRMIEKENYSFDIVAVYDGDTAASGLIIKKAFHNIPLVFHVH